MSLTFRIIVYILLFIVTLVTFDNYLLSTLILIIMIIILESTIKKQEQYKELNSNRCKYCMTEIDINATVCPICKRSQSNANNPILLIPIFIIIGIFLYCFFSPNAPETAREVFCSLGLRKGYPYCYKVDTDKLDNYINNYNHNFDY